MSNSADSKTSGEPQELSPQQEELRNVLRTQAHDISGLAGELASSYEKEAGFLNGLMRRDEQIKKLKAKNKARKKERDTHLKKIWWLESELNKSKAALEAERQDSRGLRQRLATLQSSPLGKVQRAYWNLRSRGR
ncbi:hypothetical protein [Kocuria sp.]|uniref:hypothetical protein n=1 Tax=Kocuria sp. TaxID=1871328 RepID=UPI0026E0CBED|nr:hypothetical protein [Kocuria sp.]MDO5617798.1 hypothetical protein [Kocuria sp.]